MKGCSDTLCCDAAHQRIGIADISQLQCVRMYRYELWRMGTLNQLVVGSIPTAPTNKIKDLANRRKTQKPIWCDPKRRFVGVGARVMVEARDNPREAPIQAPRNDATGLQPWGCTASGLK